VDALVYFRGPFRQLVVVIEVIVKVKKVVVAAAVTIMTN